MTVPDSTDTDHPPHRVKGTERMPDFYAASIGDGSRGLVANGPLTIKGDSMTTTSTVVEVNGREVDMTAAEPDTSRRVGGYHLERTTTGLRIRSR